MKGLLLAALIAFPIAAHADGDISKVNGAIHVTAPAGDVDTVNGSITVDSGITVENVETVNGSITLGANSIAKDVETVNGQITLQDGAKAESLDTVNGGFKVMDGASVRGDVSAVNGGTRLGRNVEIGGKLSSVNGKIEVDGARVRGGLETTNGDIEIGPGSHIEGGILVEKPRGMNWNWGKRRVPKITISPDATVDGTLKFEHEVELYVSNRAKVGRIEGASPVTFSGSEPTDADRKAAESKVER